MTLTSVREGGGGGGGGVQAVGHKLQVSEGPVWFVVTPSAGRARGKPTATDAAAGLKINTLAAPRLASSFL